MLIVNIFEVVIVGAGPAGSSLAYLLQCRGIKVLLIDKCNFPREKLCGGLMTQKTINLIEMIYKDKFIEYDFVTNNIAFYYNDDIISNFITKNPFYFVNRKDFDNFLLQKYINAGGLFFHGENIKINNISDNTIKLKDNKIIKFKFLIGADGANSQIRKLITPDYKPNGFCFETSNNNDKVGTMEIHFGCLSKGYGWIFPRKNSSIIGYGGNYKNTVQFGGKNFIQYLNNIGIKEHSKVKGAFIPYGNYVKKPYKDNIILIGDAAGLVDPITGEGLFFAFKSAYIIFEKIINKIYLNEEIDFKGLFYDIHENIDKANKLKPFVFNKIIQKYFFKIMQKHKHLFEFVCDNVISTYNISYDKIIYSYIKYKRGKV